MILFENGYAGTNMDHSPFDGMVSISLSFWIQLAIDDEREGRWKRPPQNRENGFVHDFEELDIDVDDRLR